jgi:hypothetical protein
MYNLPKDNSFSLGNLFTKMYEFSELKQDTLILK